MVALDDKKELLASCWEIPIASGWKLGSDKCQWILYRWRGKDRGWRSVAFVADKKATIRRILQESGVTCSATIWMRRARQSG